MHGENREMEKITISLRPSDLVELVRKTRKQIYPVESGVYLLFDGDEVVYVGRSEAPQ